MVIRRARNIPITLLLSVAVLNAASLFIFSVYYYRASVAFLLERETRILNLQNLRDIDRVRTVLDRMVRDLKSVANISSLVQHDKSFPHYEQQSILMMKNLLYLHNDYSQIRVISADASDRRMLGVVRGEQGQVSPVVPSPQVTVEDESLLSEAQKLSPGQYYISDIKKEFLYGENNSYPTLLIRGMVPVFDAEGTLHEIVVIDEIADRMVARLTRNLVTASSYIIDNHEKVLSRFDISIRNNKRETPNPTLLSAIKKIVSDNGDDLVGMITEKDADGYDTIYSYANIFLNNRSSSRYLTVVKEARLNKISQAYLDFYYSTIVPSLLGLLLLTMSVYWIFERNILSQLQGLENAIKDFADRVGSHSPLQTACLPAFPLTRAFYKMTDVIEREINRYKKGSGLIDDSVARLSAAGFCVLSKDGTIEKVSPQMTNLLGFSESELLGAKLSKILPTHLQAFPVELAPGQGADGDTELVIFDRNCLAVNKNGEPCAVKVRIEQMNTAGESKLLCLINTLETYSQQML